MKTTNQLVKDVIKVLGAEDDNKKQSSFAMYWAVDAIQLDNADNEGEPCSKAKAIRILQSEIMIETGLEISTATIDNRVCVAKWLRQQDKAFIKGVSWSRHLVAKRKQATWKELKMNPDNYKAPQQGTKPGEDIRDTDVIDIPPHVKGAITIIKRTMERCGYEGVMHDEEGEFDKSAHFHKASNEFGLALPHLRSGMTELMAGIN